MPKISEVIANSKINRLDAEIFLGEILNLSKTEIFVNCDFEITKSELVKFHEFEKIRLTGKSVASILGRKEFFGLEFLVDENVLIPRPETEILVEEILKITTKNLLEVGTGSGAIAISIKKNLPDCNVWASDISSKALRIAKKNAKKIGTNIKFVKSDLLEKISENFEIIVANLPYIPKNSTKIQKSVTEFEPQIALFGGNDGLDLIRKLLIQISKLSQKPKFVLLEFGGIGQKILLEKFVHEFFPNSKIEFRNDLAGISRVLKLKT